jgi:superfamily I DNA/RNA helicase
LKEQPLILRALCRRYSHIIVDEAQDIGGEHQALLGMMIAEGSQLSLVGDKNQSIYDFSGANGEFLDSYSVRGDVNARELTRNYRSVPSIVAVANKLASRSDEADRESPSSLNGAFYLPYKKEEKDKLLAAFGSLVKAAGLTIRDAVVLCRSNEGVDEWSGGEEEQGQGVVRAFVQATIWRDKHERYDEAFKHFCIGLVGLLDDGHGALSHALNRPSQDSNGRRLKRAIWSFVRDATAGLPSGALLADTEWHPQLLGRLKAFLLRLEAEFSLTPASNIGNKLARKALLAKPVVTPSDLVSTPNKFVFSTVHKVKGESIDAVMYVADKKQVKELLDGTVTEVGRIGYVAVTRARNLFVLAVPATNITEFEELLKKANLKRPGGGL